MARFNSKQFITDFHVTVLETGNFDNLPTYLAEDFILHTPYLHYPLHGRDMFRGFIEEAFLAITKIKITTDEIVVEGNKAAVRWTIEGASSRDFMNIPAGGDSRTICIMSFYRIVQEKIVEAWAVDSSLWPQVYEF